MDFVGYAERAARLVNAPIDDADDVRAFLADRAWLVHRVADRDVNHLRRFKRDLRTAYEIASHCEEAGVVHVGNSSSSVAELLIAEALLGLASLACDLSPLRLGVCQAADCNQVFVDASPNQSRRYCSDRCSSRANVAAYRARRRAAAASAG